MRKSILARGLLLVCVAALAWGVSGYVSARSGGGPSASLGTGYDLTWYTIDGGGGTSVGVGSPNPNILIGTMGQPDAGLLTGNGYTLVGGFWSGAVPAYNVYLPVVLKQ